MVGDYASSDLSGKLNAVEKGWQEQGRDPDVSMLSVDSSNLVTR